MSIGPNCRGSLIRMSDDLDIHPVHACLSFIETKRDNGRYFIAFSSVAPDFSPGLDDPKIIRTSVQYLQLKQTDSGCVGN